MEAAAKKKLALFFAASPAGVVWTWQSLLLDAAVYAAIFLPFLFTKEYKRTGGSSL